MPEIIPIRDLKNTNAISKRCHETASINSCGSVTLLIGIKWKT